MNAESEEESMASEDRGAAGPRASRGVAIVASVLLASSIPVLASSVEATPKIRVVATLTDLADIARFVGGDRVDVLSLSKGYEDPHFVLPTPSLMVAANKADLYIEMGLQLELWSERVLEGARNPRILLGRPGHVFAAEGIETLDRPSVISPSQGDVHPQGNPHLNLSPLLGKHLAANIEAGLERVDPAGAGEYRRNLKRFQDRIDRSLFGEELIRVVRPDQLARLMRAGKLHEFLDSNEYEGRKLSEMLGGWLAKLRPFRGAKVVSHHKNWAYFERDFGIRVVGTIEPKPGLTPSAGDLAELKERIRAENVRLIIHAPYYPPQYARTLAAEAGIREVTLPTLVGGVPEAVDYFALFDAITDRIASALRL
jgi:zinc/manganese transport system substrate-binding protein